MKTQRTTTRRPWFPFYPADWKESRKVRAMPRHVRDMYRELLGEIWLEGPIPNDSETVRLLLAEPKRGWEKVWPLLRGALQPAHEVIAHGSPSELTDDRLEAERQRAEEKSQEQRERALKRHHGMPRHEPPQLPPHVPDGCDEPYREDARSQITDHRSQKEEEQANADASPFVSQSELKLTPPPPKPKKSKDPTPERQAAIDVVAHYKRAWVDRMQPEDGKPPTIAGPDWKNLTTVVKEHGREASIRFVDLFLEDEDEFLFNTAYALRHLPARVNAYRATAAKPSKPAASKTAPRFQTADELEAANAAYNRAAAAKQRALFEAEGYRYVDKPDGTYDFYDPEGYLLDARGNRPPDAVATYAARTSS